MDATDCVTVSVLRLQSDSEGSLTRVGPAAAMDVEAVQHQVGVSSTGSTGSRAEDIDAAGLLGCIIGVKSSQLIFAL